MDLTTLERALPGYMRQFGEGTAQEKRTPLQAFTRPVKLAPKTGKGRLEIYSLPMVPVQGKKDSPDGPSFFFSVGSGGPLRSRKEDTGPNG